METAAPFGIPARTGPSREGAPRRLSVPLCRRTVASRAGRGERSGDGQRQAARDRKQVVFYPQGVGHVVVVAQLRKDRRCFRQAYLRDGGRGKRTHTVGQGIDLFQIVHDDIRHAQPVQAGRVIVDVDAAHLPGNGGWRGVAVQREMKIVIPGVGGTDGIADGAVRVIARDVDAGSLKIWNHQVCQTVHPVFLISAGDVGIILLCGRT